jgi:hypothetical protein
MKRAMKILGVPGLIQVMQVMQAWRIICHFLLVLACAVRSNSPDRGLNRSRAILACLAKSAPMHQRPYAVA